ncbi:MAG: hypothetical protein RIC04_13930 [Parvibaculum sp.]|uniref:hypothetical protein n=1 Tax=Parvibaculum sp. TaxID=2024848 RepID=UPI0032EAB498
MKNQYFGDQTDYIKYGILRSFSKFGAKLGIHWTLTDDDGSSDGSRTRYLKSAKEWRRYDPEIFDILVERLDVGERRLDLVDELNFIPNAVHCFDKWGSNASARMHSIESLLDRLPTGSLVFLDPDNGLEVSSARKESRNASKYVFFDELSMFWASGHSLLIYQHYPRVQRIPYVLEQLNRLKVALPHMREAALLTSHVAFLACIQSEHSHIVEPAIDNIVEHWAPHVGAVQVDGTIKPASTRANVLISPQQELSL